MKTAFSTVATPDWTLDRAAELAARLGYDGVELRTFGHDEADLACEPALTGAAKARDLFEDAGVEPCALATSIRYDGVIWPPVLGRVTGDVERPVRQTREAVRLAASMEIPYVRVFAFELQPGERRSSGLRRILERLRLAVATARHTGVKLLLENGGSFPAAADLVEIMDLLGSPLLEAAYSPVAALAGGEDPVEGARLLGRRLAMVKLKDFAGGRPALIGDGYAGFEAFVRSLGERRFGGWAVIELDRLWFRGRLGEVDHAGPEAALSESLSRLLRWSAGELTELERRKFARV